MISALDYKYFGLQNGDGCYCGNDDSKFVPVAPDECDHPCSGNENEICGSSWRLSVYGPNQVIDLSTAKTNVTTQSASFISSTTASRTTTSTTMQTTTTTKNG